MANQFPQPFVPGPARTPAPYGLFSVLEFREPVDVHWQGAGVRFMVIDIDPDTGLGVQGPTQEDRDAQVGHVKAEFLLSEDTDAAGVFTVYGQQKTSPAGGLSQGKASDRARLWLTSLEQRTVEAVLAGEVAGLTPNFASATPFTSADDVFEAVIALETFLSGNYGSRGVIHLSRGNALRGLAADVLETRGNGLFTKVGTPVAAGMGYPDDVAYASSSLLAYRSEVFENTARPYDLMDRGTNDLYAIAERNYCIGYESAALGVVTIGDSA